MSVINMRMNLSLCSQENSELDEVVVVPADEARDVPLLHALVREFEHCLAIVCCNTHGLGLRGGLGIRRVYVERESPVLAHGGVVDVHDEVLAWTRARCEPVRAPLPALVLELLDITDMRHVSAYDLPAEVAKRDVEAAVPLLHTVAGVPECLLLLDGVLDRFYLVYHDEQVEELRILAHRHVCGLVLLNNTVCICRLEIIFVYKGPNVSRA